jgi:hypothetical protein
MKLPLYVDDAQARRVTAAAQQALALPGQKPISPTRPHLPTPDMAWASTALIYSTYQQQVRIRQQQFQQQNAMLRQQASELVLEPCQAHGIAIQILGEYPLFSGLKLVHGKTTDVVIVPAEEDPLVIDKDFPLPIRVRQRLNALERAGVPFEMLYTYIAHEVPPYSVPETGPFPREIITPITDAERLSARLGIIANALTGTVISGLKAAATEGVRKAAYLGISLGGTAAALLDPLIFGAIADERGMATWFVLAQWAW